MPKPASELRLDLVSKDWVVIATGRARRPETFAQQKRIKERVSKKDCPFCRPQLLEEGVFLRYNQPNGDWSVIVVPNKFPAFSQGESLAERAEGPYQIMDGVGLHEVLITNHHKKQMAQFSVAEVRQVIDAYQERYLDLMNEKFINYVSIFHNHGREAGASVAHPHSQIIAIPIIDPDLRQSLHGSKAFFDSRRECVHCVMLEWDRTDGRRIIFENEKFVVLCPFASRVSFEVRIYPKEHHPYFERITDQEKNQLAEAVQIALQKIYKGLKDPAYNFFIHTAPCDGKDYEHYHWHFEILPKTSIWAGFELGTGIEISTIEPERAAEFLRKQ